MKPKSCLAVIAAPILCMVLGGCVRSPVVPPMASFGFNNTSFPVDIEFDRTTIGLQKGTASSYSVLFGLIAFGDCSVQTAARNGKLKEIDHLDARWFNVLVGLFERYDTIAWGKTAEQLEAPQPREAPQKE